MADNNNRINYKIFVDTDSGTASVRKLNGEIVAGAVPLDKLRSKFGNFAKTVNAADFNKFNKGLKASTAELENANKQTGAATSATLEFGRVLSDAPYGIRGVANNVQQLASNLFFMGKQVDATTGKTIGFGGAMKQLGKNLLGPAGVLVAFQGFIALIDWMSNRTSKAEKQINTFNEALTENNLKVEKMKVLASIVNDNTASIETQKDAMIDLKKLGFDPAKKSLDEFIESQEKLAVVNASIKAVEDLLADVLKRRLDLNIRAKKEFTEYFKMLNEKAVGVDIQKAVLDQLKLDQSELDKEEGEIKKQYQDLITRAFDLTDVKTKGTSGIGKLSPFKTPEELELDVESSMSAIDKLARQTELIQLNTEEKARLSMVKSEEDKTFIKEEYARRRLDITEKFEKKAMEDKKLSDIKSAAESNIAYQKKIDKDLVAFEAKLRKEGKALTDAEKKMLQDAKTVASDKKQNANEELMSTVTQIQEEYGKLFPFWKQMAAARRTAIGQGKTIGEAEEFTLQDGLKKYMEVQSAMTSFLGAEYDRQLTIEQNKTNALNNELNQRLLNENLSKDERERIQLQIGQNDEKLRKKQEAIEKKRFKLNKAANIAGATINTYLAASQIMADPSFVGRPIARFAAMATTITTGLLNVAKIARQKFQTSAGSGGAIGAAAGSNGGEGDSREFNFNLAGSTQSNQLTQSIASQLSQPIQTYVVSSEITTQQQLDLNIANTATIGG